MPLADILVCFDSSPAGEERLAAATRLARHAGAALLGVYPLYDDAVEVTLFPSNPVPAAGVSTGTAAVGVMEPTIARPRGMAQAEIAAEHFQETLRLNMIGGDWHMLEGGKSAELIDLAKTADLIVAGQFERQGRGRTAVRPEDIALACGRPVLIIPYAGNFPTIGTRVLVAWDTTREAARALHDAMPLMEMAEAATVVTVVSSESEREGALASLDRVVRHLEHKGISAQAEATLRGDLGVSDVLLSRASDIGADLIVSGAYHHSPYREALFGGVTYDLLDHMTVPVLMSH
ncbi:MAG TPA: universal stress protein [Stellaceae bacterium]|jgi:nucleotide-binding universal stress UspA family protein